MKSWHVTYYYLASGMDGVAVERDYGVVEALTAEGAMQHVAHREDKENYSFMLSCLSAKEINPEVAHMFVRRSTGIVFDRRELGTVLAALRHWQTRDPYWTEGLLVNAIANGDGTFEPLTAEEIDELCERINV